MGEKLIRKRRKARLLYFLQWSPNERLWAVAGAFTGIATICYMIVILWIISLYLN